MEKELEKEEKIPAQILLDISHESITSFFESLLEIGLLTRKLYNKNDIEEYKKFKGIIE